jgi:glycosyltransferase involved in cell wall biosynthesis
VKVTLTDKEYAGLEARYNGAETHLINVGRLNAVQSSEEFRNSDFCLVPSLVECSSAVIYEAIEHDCPIVATDFRFNREIGKAAASYFKPKEYTAAAKLIHKQLYGPDVRQRSTELRHELREIYSRNAEIRYKIIHEILNNHTYHN